MSTGKVTAHKVLLTSCNNENCSYILTVFKTLIEWNHKGTKCSTQDRGHVGMNHMAVITYSDTERNYIFQYKIRHMKRLNPGASGDTIYSCFV
jgi:hypothetical protein